MAYRDAQCVCALEVIVSLFFYEINIMDSGDYISNDNMYPPPSTV